MHNMDDRYIYMVKGKVNPFPNRHEWFYNAIGHRFFSSFSSFPRFCSPYPDAWYKRAPSKALCP